MIKLEDVSYGYKKSKTILKSIDKTIEQGKFVCIIGKNGSREIYSC